MALTGQLFKLVWGGTLFDKETWACSMHTWKPDSTTWNLSDFEDALTTWMTSGVPELSSAARLAFVKYNEINPVTGKYADNALTNTREIDGNVRGTGAPCPGQLCAAISLTTGLQRGRGHMGRFFAPIGKPWLDVDGSGQFAGYSSSAANATAALINAVHVNTTSQVVIFSKVGQLVVPVTGVKVGSIVDTQRRRRSNLPEIYTAATTPITP